jgi:hypothetical protein
MCITRKYNSLANYPEQVRAVPPAHVVSVMYSGRGRVGIDTHRSIRPQSAELLYAHLPRRKLHSYAHLLTLFIQKSKGQGVGAGLVIRLRQTYELVWHDYVGHLQDALGNFRNSKRL